MNQDAKKIIRIGTLSIFFIFIIGYAFFVSKDLVFGVKITDVVINGQSAESGAKIPSSILEVSGNAKNAVKLTLEGREISVDKNGNFNETIALLPGYNIVSLRAQDKFGHVDEKDYQITQALGN